MNQDLDTALNAAQLWRDRGNEILLLGILAEIIIDACWPDHPQLFPLLRGSRDSTGTRPLIRWRDHFAASKNIVMFGVGLIVLAGLLLERSYGNVMDDINNEIRLDLTAQAYKTVSSRQIGIMLSCLKNAPKGVVFTVPAMFDVGAERYSELLRAILRNAGFDARDQPPNTKALIGLSTPGIVLFVRDNVPPPRHAMSMQACFESADLPLPFAKFDSGLFGWLNSSDVIIGVAP